jgi:hypothetical protein
MSTVEDSRDPNFLRSMLEKGDLVCMAELVLGRDPPSRTLPPSRFDVSLTSCARLRQPLIPYSNI